MQLSPSVRAVLTVVAAVLAAVAVIVPTLGVPVWVAAVVGAVLAGLAAVGIVPPQTGGTQVGVASPAIVEPPKADVYAPADTTGLPPRP